MRATPTTHGNVPSITRRGLLKAGATTAIAGTALAAFATREASAEVTMGDLRITGDNTTLDSPPSRIDVITSGDWMVETVTPPEQVKLTLQVHVGGLNVSVDDVAEAAAFDATQGSFELSADLLSAHDGVSAGDFMPNETGESKSTEVVVRVIASAVVNGEIAAEAFAQDSATVVVSKDGLSVRVGGSGRVEVIA